MVCSSWVTTRKGFPARRHRAAMSFWAAGRCRSPRLLPRSPRATVTTSQASIHWGRLCQPRRSSILANIVRCSRPRRARAARTSSSSWRLRTKGCITAVTPCPAAASRSSRSCSVRAGRHSSTPGRVMLFRLSSTPPRVTVQVTARPQVSARRAIRPSSSKISCPGATAARISGSTGRPPGPRVTVSPAVRVTGRDRGPIRSSGPRISTINSAGRPEVARACCTASVQGRQAVRVVWDRFRRKPVSPMSSSSVSRSARQQAGPRVA